MAHDNSALAERVRTELGDELQKRMPDVFGVLSEQLVNELRGKIIVLFRDGDVGVVNSLSDAEALKKSGRLIQVPIDLELTLEELQAG